MRKQLRVLGAVAFGVGLIAATAKTAASLPPYVQAYEPRTVDERGAWMEADEYERALRDSPLRVRDEPLNAFVRGVLCRTVGEDRCKSTRVYLVQVPAMNASMTANGTMTVWTGTLLRARSEAELAAVLGHEFAHFELRHSVTGFKNRRRASDIAAWITVVGGLANTDTSLTTLSLLGGTYRFDRTQEEQADLLGLKYLGSSPYPSTAASEFWQHLMAEEDASAIGRKRRPSQHYTAGFFDSHPTHLSRAIHLRAAASKLADGGDSAAESYRQAIAPFLPVMLADQVKLNDFGGSEYLLQSLAQGYGWSGNLLFARGELYRQRGNPRDLATAAQFYNEAITAGYAAPEVRRNLGLALLRNGQKLEGRAALAEYLQLKPDGSDAKAIAALLQD